MPGKRKMTSVAFHVDDHLAVQEAIARAREVEGVSYTSVGEFVRDAVRRRIRELNEAYARLKRGDRE